MNQTIKKINLDFISRSGKNISVREPRLSDVPIMAEFINTLGREDIYLNASPENIYSHAQEEQYVTDCLYKLSHRQQVYLLAFAADKLIGSVTITKQALRQPHVGIFGITIAKEFRGDGIGKQLAQSAINLAREIDIKIITLDVFATNLPALNLYASLGFQQYGLLPKGFVYRNTLIDKILMFREV